MLPAVPPGRREPRRMPASTALPLRCRPLALEPRLLFDGAAVATADVAAADPAPASPMPASPMPASPERAAPAQDAGPADGAAGEAPPAWGAGRDAGTAGAEPLLQVVAAAGDAAGTGAAGETGEVVSISLHKGAFTDCAALAAAVQAGPEAVGGADVAGADAADVVHYAITIGNDGPGNAFDLQVRDQLPPQVDVAAVSQLRLIGEDGSAVDFSGGDVLRNAATGETIRSEAAFAQALFSDCAVEFADPGDGQGYLGGSCEAGRPGRITIAYQVTLPGTVVAGSALCNQADVVQVATRECGPNLVDACAPPADGALVTIDSGSLETRLTGTSQVHTGGADAVIGEVLTYETVITVPEGRSPDAVLTQWLDPGLSLVAVDSIVYADGVDAQAAPDPTAIVPDVFDGGEANRFVVDFGDISNRRGDGNGGGCGDGTITVTYRAVTSNLLANQQGRELVTTAGYRSGGEEGCAPCGAAGEPLVELADMAEPATVVEPVLGVNVVPDGRPVEAGGVAEFLVTVSNDGRIDAFDVTVDDLVLPAGLELAPQSWSPAGTDGALTAVLPAGGQVTFRLVTLVAPDAPAGGELSVDVQVRYTSLPDAGGACEGAAPGAGSRDLSPFVDGSDRERTGDDGPQGLDDYVAADRGSVVAVAGTLPPPCPPPPAPPPPAAPPEAAPPPPAAPPEAAPPPPAAPPTAVSPPPAAPPEAPSPPPPVGATPSPSPGPSPGAPPVESPLSPAPGPSRAPSAPGQPGMLSEDDWQPPRAAPLADLVARPMAAAPGAADIFQRTPQPAYLAEDLPLSPPQPDAALHEGEAGKPAAVAQKPVAPEDDCVPVEPPVVKPKVVKRSVFADGPAKPQGKRFSEQVDSARQRLSPPTVAKPRPAPDC